SPAAPLLATCGEDGTVVLWDRTAADPRVRTFGPGPFGGAVRAVAFTPDGRYLATANANGTGYLLRLGTPPGPPTREGALPWRGGIWPSHSGSPRPRPPRRRARIRPPGRTTGTA